MVPVAGPVVVTYQEGDNPSATVPIDPPSDENDGTSNTFTITIDSSDDVVVTLQSVTTAAGHVRLGTSRATTEIADSDTVTVSVEGPSNNVPEGNGAIFDVKPTATVTREVDGQDEVVPIIVSYTTVAGTATGADFQAKNGRLTFTSGGSTR